MPTPIYAHHYVRFDRNNVMPEDELRRLLADQGFAIAHMSYRVTDSRAFEYRMIIRSTDTGSARRLAEVLRGLDAVREFRISPTGD